MNSHANDILVCIADAMHTKKQRRIGNTINRCRPSINHKSKSFRTGQITIRAADSDYVNVNGSDNPVPNVGGNYNNDLNAGVSYLNANNNVSNSNDNIGSRLNFIDNKFTVILTSALAGTHNNTKIGWYRQKGNVGQIMKATVIE